ncbi:hypothetical protein [Rufibacter immobilis]|nr:hypothetical protein [Rufibacter immobilis]
MSKIHNIAPTSPSYSLQETALIVFACTTITGIFTITPPGV